MPVILGPDGPSLGGFVCPVTVIEADLWQLGQLKAGDRVQFIAVDLPTARRLADARDQESATLTPDQQDWQATAPASPIVLDTGAGDQRLVARLSGDTHLLLEVGAPELDLVTRFRAHALMQALQAQDIDGIVDLTPGIRSLQVHYCPRKLPLPVLLQDIAAQWARVSAARDLSVPSRIVHLPLSWDDPACQLAIDKYMTTVRKDAPWCPSNLEFIRRINDLPDIDAVRQTVFDASYLVMGLGDVYLGAPVATPLDPRHRLVTTKYNPARTWTAENSVGIGGAYLCVYGMEGPAATSSSAARCRCGTATGPCPPSTASPGCCASSTSCASIRSAPMSWRGSGETFRWDGSLADRAGGTAPGPIPGLPAPRGRGHRGLQITPGRGLRRGAPALDRHRTGALRKRRHGGRRPQAEAPLPEGCHGVESDITGNLWQVRVQVGQQVQAGQELVVLESMKMEITVNAPQAGVVREVRAQPGASVRAGQCVVVIEANRGDSTR